MSSTSFRSVVDAWDRDGAAGGNGIHPLPVDSAEWWALGEVQAEQVADYAGAGDLVIDFGCGYGRLSIPLVNAGYNVLAVDASQAMLDGLLERANAADVEVGTLRSDGSDLGIIIDHVVGERAAVVIARAVLIHHDYAGVEAIVDNLARVLRPGGHLIADWPVDEHPRERRDWIDVTRWHPHHRLAVARAAGLEPVDTGDVSVWRKRS
jgi:SAM-dependent methyltransferase